VDTNKRPLLSLKDELDYQLYQTFERGWVEGLKVSTKWGTDQ